MSDGSRLRQSWHNALNDAEALFRQLLTSTPSNEWKRVHKAGDSSSSTKKGKARMSSVPELADVIVHRKSSKSGETVYRLVLDVSTGDEAVSLEPWKAVLATPELRQEWDPAVEEAHLVEMFDQTTRISKTNFTLGWPANPRDAVTISRSIHDTSTLIDISTSLPRSPDEPAYLRPSPPYVRSHVTLFAWCIQHVQPPQSPTSPLGETPRRRNSSSGRVRITCFWQHDFKAMWNLGSSGGLVQQLSTMTLGLLKTVLKRGTHVPRFIGYGNGVSVERIRFQIDREALTIDYAIVPDDEEHHQQGQLHGMDDLHALREQRRLTRSVECLLPSSEGWDVRLTAKASSEAVENLPWTAQAIRSSSCSSASHQAMSQPDQITLRFSHSPLLDDHSVLKVQVKIEVSKASSGLRLNGLPQTIEELENRDPSSHFAAQQILQDVSSAANLSFQTSNSVGTVDSIASTSSSTATLVRRNTERTAGAEKSILSRVRRNYIYFSSLLQEPEAKWRQVTDARGVSITQLDSIDPTLVVYRAEATFVGVGLWDLYGAVVSPGAKSHWDKQHEDAVLLEDVNELTELWHFKTKPAWPVNGRDAVLLKTVYKSPTTIHVFSFSADDPHLFPNIPPVDPNVIRTQVDLQGWAIEALSPTTTLLTLLEQSDPKGWANKTSIPTQMINTLAGIGEFAIKYGGPPVVTRLAGAKANDIRYDYERSSFRVEYEAAPNRRAPANGDAPDNIANSDQPVVECELRCDIDTWAPSLDIVVDPPPQTITCLRRHRLSPEGGGLWLTHTHDALFVNDERLQVIIRRAPGQEKGLVMVNGTKVPVDVEELPKHEIESLVKQKRTKPPRIPLDQPPVVGVIRRRKAEWDADAAGSGAESGESSIHGAWASAPQLAGPLTRLLTYAVDTATTTTQSYVAAISPAAASGVPSSSKLPMQYALEALAWTQEAHTSTSTDGWVSVGDKGLSVHRKLFPEISPVIPVHKGSKVIEGISGEELASIISNRDCRRSWDERFDSLTFLESYGGEAKTSFLVSRSGFPFRDRGFYLASVMSRAHMNPALSRRSTGGGDMTEPSNGSRNAIFYVSASFSPDSVIPPFSSSKINSYALPIGRVYLDAWILETLDPYSKENYAIPSARCTRFVAVDYAGSIPAAVNSLINVTLPRAVLAVEAYVKGIAPLPITRLPTPGLLIAAKKVEEGFLPTAWKLKQRDDQRVLVNSVFTPEDRVYRTTILVKNPFPAAPLNNSVSHRNQATPRPSRLVVSHSPQATAIDGLPESSSSFYHPPASSPSPNGRATSPASRHQRDRAASASSVNSLYAPSSERTNSTLTVRGRSSSTAFTVKGEVRPSTDMLVGEVVIDSKMYPDGYDVHLRSWMRSGVGVGSSGSNGSQLPLRSLAESEGKGSSEATSNKGTEQAEAQGQGQSQGAGYQQQQSVLPLCHTLHTMPSSPLHSSGLNAESPTRHLLRLTLPTAQYQVSTVKDPLTGQTQSAPPLPDWLLGLLQDRPDDGTGAGAIIEVEVRPGSGASSGMSKGSQGKEARMTITVDGKEAVVLNDKESLTSLGREELLEDRVNKMAILSRMPNEAEPLPEVLRIPIAIADDFLDSVGQPESLSENDGGDSKTAGSNGLNGVDRSSTTEGKAGTTGRTEEENFGDEKGKLLQSTVLGPGPHASHAASTGLLWFLNGYSNPLTRFRPNGASPSLETDIGADGSGTASHPAPDTKEAALSPRASAGELGQTESTTSPTPAAATATSGRGRTLYPVSTVIVVALIAFLIGSLLRSLLSPADFIYVATSGPEAEAVGSGWREIRRLVEIKYLIGGWDFQIAVVRRH